MTTIALNKLTTWNGNVRKTGASDGIDELAASIAAHGLLQSLVVRKAARGKFAVVAGQRRFLALSSLAKRDQVPADLPVECRLLEGDADAAEIGLAENVMRIAMHPADQFEAFRDLIDKGSSATDVATRFGVPHPSDHLDSAGYSGHNGFGNRRSTCKRPSSESTLTRESQPTQTIREPAGQTLSSRVKA